MPWYRPKCCLTLSETSEVTVFDGAANAAGAPLLLPVAASCCGVAAGGASPAQAGVEDTATPPVLSRSHITKRSAVVNFEGAAFREGQPGRRLLWAWFGRNTLFSKRNQTPPERICDQPRAGFAPEAFLLESGTKALERQLSPILSGSTACRAVVRTKEGVSPSNAKCAISG